MTEFHSGVRRRLRHVALSPSDLEIAEMALERGWITEEQLDGCLEEHEGTEGTKLPIRVILVVRRYLTPGQLDELHRQRRPKGETALEAPTRDGHPDRIGRFEIQRLVGTGGMGNVYLAHDPQLRREVALKVVRGEPGSDKLERFRREAIAAARLRHPGIISVYEVGADEGFYYIAMDCHRGGTLADAIASTDLPLRDKILKVRDMARAVAHAHSQGIVHRDLKPRNVLLDRDGRPVIADFGLARIKDLSMELTQPGVLLGTVHYMSPEQARGGVADERSDVYSLGVILYEILAGTVPFRAGEAAVVLSKILEEEPVPPRSVRAGVPIDLEVVCLKAMEKESAGRYERAADLARDLDLFLEGEPILARGPSSATRVMRKLRKRWRIVTGIAGALAIAAVLGVRLQSARSEVQATKIQAAAALTRQQQEADRERKRREEALGKLKDASDRVSKAILKYSYRPESANIVELHRHMSEAMKLVDEAALVLSDHVEVFRLRACHHEVRGDFRRAFETYSAGVRLHPKDAELLLARARCTLEWRAVLT